MAEVVKADAAAAAAAVGKVGDPGLVLEGEEKLESAPVAPSLSLLPLPSDDDDDVEEEEEEVEGKEKGAVGR